MHSDKPTIAAVRVVHQEMISLQQFLLSGRIIYVSDFVFNQGCAPTCSEWSIALPVAIEAPHIVTAVYIEWTEDVLVFRGQTSK